MNKILISRPVYVPKKSRAFPLLQSYVTYSERSVIYHYESRQYPLSFPRKILYAFPLQIPYQLDFIVIVFSNSVIITRLSLSNGTLSTHTLYSLSIIIDSIQGHISHIREGKAHFLLLFNTNKLFSFTSPPLILRSTQAISDTEFSLFKKMGSSIKMNESPFDVFLRTLNGSFSKVAAGKKDYVANENAMYLVEKNGDLKTLYNDEVFMMVSGKESPNKHAKEPMCLLTKNAFLRGEIGETGFKEIQRFEINDKIKQSTCVCVDNIMIISCWIGDLTTVYITNETTKIIQMRKGRGVLAKHFGLIDDHMVLMTTDETETWMEEIPLTREERSILPIIPQSDKSSSDSEKQKEKRRLQEAHQKHDEYIRLENEKSKIYVEKCTTQYGDTLHESFDFYSNPFELINDKEILDETIDELRTSITVDNFVVPTLDSSYYDIFASYINTFDELHETMIESRKLVQDISDLLSQCNEREDEYVSLLENLQKIN
ncbi:Uncharacterized protein QTN25_007292 [Entamoeba marina]